MSTTSNPASEESIGRVIQEAAEKLGVDEDVVTKWCVGKHLKEIVNPEPEPKEIDRSDIVLRSDGLFHHVSAKHHERVAEFYYAFCWSTNRPASLGVVMNEYLLGRELPLVKCRTIVHLPPVGVVSFACYSKKDSHNQMTRHFRDLRDHGRFDHLLQPQDSQQ